MEPASDTTSEIEIQNGRKAKERNQCNFASASVNSLRTHIRTRHYIVKNLSNATNVTLHQPTRII